MSPFAGKHAGPITSSANGLWLAFQSERFHADNSAQGWAGLTLVKSDFSSFHAVVVAGNSKIAVVTGLVLARFGSIV